MLKLVYCMYGTFGSDYNLVVWRFQLHLPILMYTNTNVLSVGQVVCTHYLPVWQTQCLQIITL